MFVLFAENCLATDANFEVETLNTVKPIQGFYLTFVCVPQMLHHESEESCHQAAGMFGYIVLQWVSQKPDDTLNCTNK